MAHSNWKPCTPNVSTLNHHLGTAFPRVSPHEVWGSLSTTMINCGSEATTTTLRRVEASGRKPVIGIGDLRGANLKAWGGKVERWTNLGLDLIPSIEVKSHPSIASMKIIAEAFHGPWEPMPGQKIVCRMGNLQSSSCEGIVC